MIELSFFSLTCVEIELGVGSGVKGQAPDFEGMVPEVREGDGS